MAESPYERARRLSGGSKPSLITGGSLEDLMKSYSDVKNYNAILADAKKNDDRTAGEKRHNHEFYEGDENPAESHPDSLSTYIGCAVEGCPAELHHEEDARFGEARGLEGMGVYRTGPLMYPEGKHSHDAPSEVFKGTLLKP